MSPGQHSTLQGSHTLKQHTFLLPNFWGLLCRETSFVRKWSHGLASSPELVSWVCYLQSLFSFTSLNIPWLDILFYSPLPTENLLLFSLLLLAHDTIPTCLRQTHTQCSLSLSLRNPDADARNVSAALLTQSLTPSWGHGEGRATGRGVRVSTLLLAWLIFLPWYYSGYPAGNRSSCFSFLCSTSVLHNNLTPCLGWTFQPKTSTINGAQHLSPPPSNLG